MTTDRADLTTSALIGGLAATRQCLLRLTRGRVRLDHGAFPDDLEIEDGYPSDDRVDEIRCVSIRDADRWLRDVLPHAVNALPCGHATVERVPCPLNGRPIVEITVTTGGWSGVESIVYAVLDHFVMRQRLAEQHRGGKYVFHVLDREGDDGLGACLDDEIVDGIVLTQSQRLGRILACAKRTGTYLPGGPRNRADCKVLVKKGLLEPNCPMGYRPTDRAWEDDR